MKTAYLHVGIHKTGSTSLQSFLSANAATLARLGLEVPDLNGEIRRFHRRLAAELGKGKGTQDKCGTFADLAKMLKRTAGDILISNELLSVRLADRERLDQMVDFFGTYGYRLHLIGYVRNFPEYFNSRYSQGVKRLYWHDDFSSYLRRAMGDRLHDPNYLFGAALAHTKVDVTIKHFDTCASSGLEWSLLDTVLGEGYDRSLFTVGERTNESYHPSIIYISRLVAKELQSMGTVRKELLPYVRAIRALASEKSWSGVKFCGLTDRLAEEIRRFYKEKGDAFAQRVWGMPWPVAGGQNYISNEFDPQIAGSESVRKLKELAEGVLQGRRRADVLRAMTVPQCEPAQSGAP